MRALINNENAKDKVEMTELANMADSGELIWSSKDGVVLNPEDVVVVKFIVVTKTREEGLKVDEIKNKGTVGHGQGSVLTEHDTNEVENPVKNPSNSESVFDEEKDFGNVPQWKQVLSLVILILTLLGMVFEEQIGIKLSVAGCIGALALILTGVISEKDALKSIDLKTIFLFGGTLSLASALSSTGAGEMIANKVVQTLGQNPSPYILTFVVFILCCIMTNFMSNTATTALMVPICISIAQGMGADPRAVLMACVIGGSCAYATPIGMPANTMVVGAGGYTFMDYVKSGFPLIIIATVVSMIILPVAFPFFP